MSSTLLDPTFVTELEALRRRLEIRARSGGAGEHTAKRRGGSAEFQEHRPYAPGDDLRRIDWAAYARTGEPVLKLFRAEEDVVVRILCDASKSLEHGEPSKIHVAKRVCAAVAYMALARSERAQVLVGDDGLRTVTTPVRGRSGLPAVLRHLDAVETAGGTDLARSIEAVLRRLSRPGLLVVVSDFFDSGALLDMLGRAVLSGHDVALVQVVSPDEVEPDFDGDWTLEDAETGAVVEVTMDAAAIEAYVLRFAGLCEELRAWARRHRGTYLRVVTDEPLEPVMRRFVARAID